MKDSEVLLAAAKLIEEKGMARVVLKDSYGGHCLMGAIAASMGLEVTSTDPYPKDLGERPYDILAQKIANKLDIFRGTDLWKFGDFHTKDEVVAKLQELAAVFAEEDREGGANVSG